MSAEDDEVIEFLVDAKAVDSRVRLAKNIGILGLVSTLILSIIFVVAAVGLNNDQNATFNDTLNSLSTSSNTDNSSTSDVFSDSSWVPSGYNVWPSDSNIAWKWVEKAQCTDYECVQTFFISRDGCPNGLYAAVNWLDSSENAVSYNNASLPSLRALQIAKLKFDDIEGTGKTAQMSEINCR